MRELILILVITSCAYAVHIERDREGTVWILWLVLALLFTGLLWSFTNGSRAGK